MTTLSPKIEIYTTMFCPFCIRAKRLLDAKGVGYDETDVTTKLSLRRAMADRAGGRTSVPQIFIDGQHIGGWDELLALERAGQLDQMLKVVS